MKRTCVNKIILVNDDGSTKEIEKGAAIGINGNQVDIDLVNISYVELVNVAIGLLGAISDIGLGDMMGKAIEFYFGDDSDAGLQDNT